MFYKQNNFFFFFLTGGLFDSDTDDVSLAFQYAVEAVNNEKLSYSNYRLEAVPVTVKYGDQFDVSKKLCKVLRVSQFKFFFADFYF